MNQTVSRTSTHWSSMQAYTLAAICLLAGVLFGWLVRGSQSPVAATVQAQSATAPMPANEAAQPTPEQMKQMADTQAAPLLAKLKTDPENPQLLADIGNIYYDTKNFPPAIDYYQHALKLKPDNAGVRTDMATAYWYSGNADTAIQEFNKALVAQPNQANALFNLGIVKWQGKMDIDGAVATWQKLLDTNPNYENKDRVLELIQQAKKHTGVKAGTTAKPLS